MVSGGRRKEESYDAADAEVHEFMDEETRQKIRDDPMLALELRGEDKRKV